MALVYKRSDQKNARAYERSSGMEPNPGVTHLTVVGNPGDRRSVEDNPFQWVEGRGQRHRHVSKPYDTLRGAIGWKKRHRRSGARLYPVDEKGTIVSRPLSKRLLSNRTSRRTGMAYNIGALRRAMRSNPKRRRSPVREEKNARGVKVSSRGRRKTTRNRKRRKSTANRRRRTSRRKVATNRRRRRRSTRRTSRRRRSRRSRPRRNTRRKVASNRRRRSRRSSRRGSRRRRSRRRVSRNRGRRRSTGRRSSKRARAARKGWRTRRAKAEERVARRRSSRRGSRRTSRRRRSRRRVSRNRGRRRSGRAATANRGRRRVTSNRRRSRRTSRRRRSRRRRSVRSNAKRGGKRRASGRKRGGKRRTSRKYYWGRKRISARGKEYLDKYFAKGYMPAVAPVYHSGKSKSGAPSVLVYPIPADQGRLSSRKTRRRGTYKRKGVTRRRRSRALGASYRGRRKRRMTANKRRRRSSRRRSSRRHRSKPGIYRNRRRRRSTRRRSTRRGSRRTSRRRRSRRRLSRNLLATSKVQYSGRGRYRAGRPRGKRHQVVMYGSKSKGRPGKGGRRRRISGYPVYVPGHVVERASVRRYKRLGGGAKDAHERARRRGYSERRWPKRRIRRNTRRTSMRRNRRKSRRRSRRRSTRRNPRWVVANRRRRRLRKNQILGVDWMKDVVTPVIGGTAGFVGARVLSNGLANVEAIRNLLDKDKPAAEAYNTKIAANVLGIVATLGLATQVKIVKDNQGALVTGMGLALVDRMLGRMTGEAAAYLSGFGEYVSQPLGEYVSQPLGETLYAAAGMGAYVNDGGMGEYVNQPLGAYAEGVDPADQGTTDSLMDVMEAAAGVGQGPMAAAAGMGDTLYATAGMGETLYAAAGLGVEADASLQRMYQRERIPFHSIHTPTGIARPVTATLPFSRPVPSSLVTPEGKGYAGGLFARHLFAGMF